jgi:hypothetical protein
MRPLLASLFVLFALALPLAALAADTPSPTAVAACQSEYAQIGADAFKAKYGATEPFGHCYQAHAPAVTTATTTTTTSGDDLATAACKAEYIKLGPDAFKAKYGATEAFGNCVKAQTTAPAPPTKPTTSIPDTPAGAACKAEYLKLGGDAFKAKYGASDPLGACLKAQTTTTTTTTTSDKPKPSTSNGVDGAASVAGAFCNAEAKALGKVVFLAEYGPKEATGNCVRTALAKAKSLVASCKASSGSSKDAFKACIAADVQPRRR